ncbi:MAG: DNA-directed RNA polymerase subunit alpha, partial [Synergistaceae bacterium]|nr:DNA-directed RNA polymerase subunit alpha [Synergistaceae bacterium]
MENTKFKVYSEEKSQDYGKFFIEPLERGYGDTLGNALRRLLLSSIKGAAVTAVKIDGVLHEFSTIKGIREDVIEILMNLKHIPIKARTESATVNEDGFKIITLDSDDLPKEFFTREENPGVITAQDINAVAWDHDYEFCGDGKLCTLEPDAHLLMEIYVEQGTGYLSAERERPSQPPLPIDAMLADAIFSPVKRVNYRIEPARVGQSIDFERLILEVWT